MSREKPIYALKVEGLYHHGWISAFGFTIARNIPSAMQFETRREAESYAVVLVAKVPHYIGKLKVVRIVIGQTRAGKLYGYEASGRA